MDKTQVIIFSAAIALVAVRLYQKYIKKNNKVSGTDTKSNSSTSFPSNSKEDDYEPYAKK